MFIDDFLSYDNSRLLNESQYNEDDSDNENDHKTPKSSININIIKTTDDNNVKMTSGTGKLE